MENKWITTQEMLEDIKQHPDQCIEYDVHLMGPLVRTHCFYLNSKTNQLQEDGGDAEFFNTSEDEVLNWYGNASWRKV